MMRVNKVAWRAVVTILAGFSTLPIPAYAADLVGASQSQSQWANPLFLAILGATVTGIASICVTLINSFHQRRIETSKSEAGFILEVLKTGEPETANVNLRFLLNTGLITDKNRRRTLEEFLLTSTKEAGPYLPAPEGHEVIDGAKNYRIFFDQFRNDLTERAIQIINFAAERYVISGLKTKIIIIGHSDHIEATQEGPDIAYQRARSVAIKLEERGILPEMIQSYSVKDGSSMIPPTELLPDTGVPQNRRAEIFIPSYKVS